MPTLDENLAELTKLFGRGFVYGKKTANNPLRKAIQGIVESHKEGNHLSRDAHNASLSLIIKNLNEIKNHDRELLGAFLSALANCDTDTYYGFRLEISEAAFYTRNEIPFVKSESPDFTLKGEWEGVFVECTSVHLSTPKSRKVDLQYKIDSAIKSKSKKSYCNNNTELAIDITNIEFYHALNDIRQDHLKQRKRIADSLKTSHFGSVLVYRYMVNMDKKLYQWKYTRVDSEKIGETLLKYLDTFHPFGHDVTHSPIFIPRG